MKTSKIVEVGVNFVNVEEATHVITIKGPRLEAILSTLSVGEYLNYNDKLGEEPFVRKGIPPPLPDLRPLPGTKVKEVRLMHFFTRVGAHPEQEVGILLGYLVELQFESGNTQFVRSRILRSDALSIAAQLATEFAVSVTEYREVQLGTPEEQAEVFISPDLPIPSDDISSILPSGATLPA